VLHRSTISETIACYPDQGFADAGWLAIEAETAGQDTRIVLRGVVLTGEEIDALIFEGVAIGQ